MSRIALLAAVLVALTGCDTLPRLTGDGPTAQVASHPCDAEPAPKVVRTKASYAPANEALAFRVDRVGGQLLAANKNVGVGRPYFVTIGAPAPEIFHAGTGTVCITEGLVRKCATDRELAAVLASELGKMAVERQTSSRKNGAEPEVPLPVDLPIGGHGYAGDADPSHAVEMAKFEEGHPRHRPPARPDPNAVARYLLKQAGHPESDLQAVQPLLQAAQQQDALERQFKGTPPPGSGGWRP
jgi:hypothetical protein